MNPPPSLGWIITTFKQQKLKNLIHNSGFKVRWDLSHFSAFGALEMRLRIVLHGFRHHIPWGHPGGLMVYDVIQSFIWHQIDITSVFDCTIVIWNPTQNCHNMTVKINVWRKCRTQDQVVSGHCLVTWIFYPLKKRRWPFPKQGLKGLW